MTDKDLREAFKEAAEIAKAVPASMQDAAFHRALDQILGDGESAGHQRSPRKRGTQRKTKAEPKTKSDADDLVDRIDRTQYPEITTDASVLDRALLLLQAAQELDVDGLSATQVSSILTGKFRVRTSRRGVAKALDKAGTLVDRSKSGNQVTYKIMGAGERHLEQRSKSPSQEDQKQTPTRKKRTTRRKQTSNKQESGDRSKSSGRKRRGRPGPKAALEDLIGAGFFNTARTMSEVQERLSTKVGHRYKATDLSPTFGRLLREDKLDRERNDDGKYEYSAK